MVERAVEAIRKAAQTGRIGDGKIFVSTRRGSDPHPHRRDRAGRDLTADFANAAAVQRRADLTDDQRGLPTMKTAKDVLKAIKDNDVKYVDFRFTDPRGKWQHVTFDVSLVDEDIFAEGTMFDGSSIAGWKAINESDMTLHAGPEHGAASTRSSQPPRCRSSATSSSPTTGEPYSRDPRGIAKKAEAF